MFDIHTMKDSQNGFDNSGQTMGFQWTTALNSEYVSEQTFEHWPIRDARWIGTFDQDKAEYTSINYENIQHSLDVIEAIVQRYKTHPAVQGLEVRTTRFFRFGNCHRHDYHYHHHRLVCRVLIFLICFWLFRLWFISIQNKYTYDSR